MNKKRSIRCKQTNNIYITEIKKLKSRAHYSPEPAWGPCCHYQTELRSTYPSDTVQHTAESLGRDVSEYRISTEACCRQSLRVSKVHVQNLQITTACCSYRTSCHPGGSKTICPPLMEVQLTADLGVRSLHMAKLQAAGVPIN